VERRLDRLSSEYRDGGASPLEVKRVSSLKDDSQVAIVRSVLNSKCLLHKKIQEWVQCWKIKAFILKPLHMRNLGPWMRRRKHLGLWCLLGEEGLILAVRS